MTNTTHGNKMLAPFAGAASMAHPDVIRACRVAYRAAAVAGDPAHAGIISRAWCRGDEEIVAAHLDGLIWALSQIEGTWDIWTELKQARAALVF